MHNMGAAHIIAIDVAFHDTEVELTNYGDFLSGWWVLYKRKCPFTSKVKVLDLQDIQRRLTFVHGASHLQLMKNLEYCEYMRPPIERFKTLAFASFEKIRDVGYVYGKQQFENMAKAGRLGRFNDWFIKEPRKKDKHPSLTDYSFIDLAKIVCKLPEVSHPDSDHHHLPYFFSDDEYFNGVENEMDSEAEGHIRLTKKKRQNIKARNSSANANVTKTDNPPANGCGNIIPDDVKSLELTLPKQPLHISTSVDVSAVISSSSNSANENDENAKVPNADENEMESITTNATTTATQTITTTTNATMTATETITTTPNETITTTTNATTTASETIATTTNEGEQEGL